MQIFCADSAGNIIHSLTQYDQNLFLFVSVQGEVYSPLPTFHFSNKALKESIAVQAVEDPESEGSATREIDGVLYYIVPIPNEILTYEHAIYVHMSVIEDNKYPAVIGLEEVEGYYNENDGGFYEDAEYETPIEGSPDCLYIDLTTDKTYIYDTAGFEEISRTTSAVHTVAEIRIPIRPRVRPAAFVAGQTVQGKTEAQIIADVLITLGTTYNLREATIDGIEAALGSLDDRVTANEADISTLKGRMTTAEGNIGSLKSGSYIDDGAIANRHLASSAVTTGKMAQGAVTTDKLAASAVETAKIKDSAVTTDKINNSAVTAGKIANGSVTADKLASGAVTTAKITNGSVTTDKLADGAVTTAKITNSNVTTDKLADGAVTTAKIANGGVTTDKLASGAVTTAKMTNKSVTTDKLADGAVTTAKIGDYQITAPKLATGILDAITSEVRNDLSDEVLNFAHSQSLSAAQVLQALSNLKMNYGVIDGHDPFLNVYYLKIGNVLIHFGVVNFDYPTADVPVSQSFGFAVNYSNKYYSVFLTPWSQTSVDMRLTYEPSTSGLTINFRRPTPVSTVVSWMTIGVL